MTCCGKQLVEAWQIVKGNFLNLMASMKILPEKTCQNAQARLSVCRACEFQTWMTWSEFWQWVDANGGKEKFAKKIADLTGWPMLPKQDYTKNQKLFCRVCKCWLPAKAFSKNENCPKGYWKGLNNG